MIEDMHEVLIPLLIRNDSSSFNYENFIKGYHVQINAWSQLRGECLFGKKEQGKEVENNAVAVIHLNSSDTEGVVSYVHKAIQEWFH